MQPKQTRKTQNTVTSNPKFKHSEVKPNSSIKHNGVKTQISNPTKQVKRRFKHT